MKAILNSVDPGRVTIVCGGGRESVFFYILAKRPYTVCVFFFKWGSLIHVFGLDKTSDGGIFRPRELFASISDFLHRDKLEAVFSIIMRPCAVGPVFDTAIELFCSLLFTCSWGTIWFYDNVNVLFQITVLN